MNAKVAELPRNRDPNINTGTTFGRKFTVLFMGDGSGGDSGEITVKASGFDVVEGGALVFYNKDGETFQAFNPSAWARVEEVA